MTWHVIYDKHDRRIFGVYGAALEQQAKDALSTMRTKALDPAFAEYLVDPHFASKPFYAGRDFALATVHGNRPNTGDLV